MSIGRHIRRLLALAIPIVGSQFASMSLWIVDVIMLGHLGVEPLGAASLGRVWLFGVLIFAMGLLFGIDPIASQAHGAGDLGALSRVFSRGLGLAILLSIPVGISWLLTGRLLLAAGQTASLSAAAHTYVIVQLPGLPFFLVFLVIKQVLQAQGIVKPEFWITLLANGFNALANWALIFGHLGAPAMGVEGAGWATASTQIVMCLALALWMLNQPRQRRLWAGLSEGAITAAGLGRIAHFGWPVGLQIGLEMWAFQLATLWAGWLGETELAAHTVAITLASASFMVPLGVALAASARVGNLIGGGEPLEAQRASWVALGLGACFMAVAGLIFLFGRDLLPRLFTDDPGVLALAAAVLPIAAAFQIFDGLQVVGGGILRGMGQTRPAALFNLVGYYALALPLAWWLAFRAGQGLEGLWWGLALALALVAVALLGWIRFRGPDRVESRVRLDL